MLVIQAKFATAFFQLGPGFLQLDLKSAQNKIIFFVRTTAFKFSDVIISAFVK